MTFEPVLPLNDEYCKFVSKLTDDVTASLGVSRRLLGGYICPEGTLLVEDECYLGSEFSMVLWVG